MNAAAKRLMYRQLTPRAITSSQFWREHFLIVSLLICVLISAFSVVYTKDLNRRLFIELQSLESVRDAAQVEFGKLLLEQSTWSTQARVEQIAKNELHMALPLPKSVVVVR